MSSCFYLQIRDSAIFDACVAHLTVLPSKSVSAAYLLKRALTAKDVLQCAGRGGKVDKQALLSQLQKVHIINHTTSKKINRSQTHTHTDRTTPPTPTHAHDKNNTPNPDTNTPHTHLTTLEGGATTVRATYTMLIRMLMLLLRLIITRRNMFFSARGGEGKWISRLSSRSYRR